MADDGLAALVRRVDPDHFLCALFAPPEQRASLWLLAAFNHELARARAMVREPAVTFIRLQWWRDVIEGAERRHPVATPLSAALHAGVLQPTGLARMIDGRELEADDMIETVDAWRDYLFSTHGELAVQCGRLLGVRNDPLERLRLIGAAYGAGWLLRSRVALAAQGRSLLPAGVPPAELVRLATGWLRDGAIRLPRRHLAAALPGVLAGRDLRRWDQPFRPRGLADRFAVLRAYAMRSG